MNTLTSILSLITGHLELIAGLLVGGYATYKYPAVATKVASWFAKKPLDQATIEAIKAAVDEAVNKPKA